MEERQIVTPTYRSVLIEREKSFPDWIRHGISW